MTRRKTKKKPKRKELSAQQCAGRKATKAKLRANLVVRTKARRNTTASIPTSPLSTSSLESYLVADDEKDAVPDDMLHNATTVADSPSPVPRNTTSLVASISHTQLPHQSSGPSHTATVHLNAANGDGLEQSHSDQELGANSTSLSASSPTTHGCTSKHFRVRCITGRDSIDGDTYYVVSWKSSWVPSDQIITPANDQDRYIKIDGKDWLIAETIKWKMKKGVPKQLVRWIDDTLEPVKRLRRALPAIREFEQKPRLDRRVVSFDESLIDLTKILAQSNDEFREAQAHLAKKWPAIEPRNDIDLLPAFRQIMMEISPRADDDISNRKTHQRLIDLPQLRRLRWSEEYLLSGRFYEYTLPKRNALLLQVVAEVADNGCCERCVSDSAPFRECVRDTSEDSPWLNGACANCGAAEANSTCCHHHVGTAHLERGRSSGLNSERLRELIDPTRSVSLLSNLEFEKDDDSDTYSADSYAESDNSSVFHLDDMDDDLRPVDQEDGDDQEGGSNDNDSRTPNLRSEDASSSTHARYASTSDVGSSGLFVTQSASPSGLSTALTNAPMSERFTPQITASLPIFAFRQLNRSAALSSRSASEPLDSGRRQTTPVYFDRSSSTLAAESTRENTRVNHPNDGSSETYQHYDYHDMYDIDGTADVDGSTYPDPPMRAADAPESGTAANSRHAVMQSVEAFVQNPATHPGTSTKQQHVPSSTANGRKRAASGPSAHERASNRPTTGSSHSSHSTSLDSTTETTNRKPLASPISAVAKSETESKIDRGHTHIGCRANRPCMHPDHVMRDDGAMVTVYHDDVDASRSFNLGEVRYILSHCTCHWASAFAKVWDGWREESSTPADAELTKPQFLLQVWPEFLLEAARECCPTHPARRVTITID